MNRHAIFLRPSEESQFEKENDPADLPPDPLSTEDLLFVHHVAYCSPTGEEYEVKKYPRRKRQQSKTGKDSNNHQYEHQLPTPQGSGVKNYMTEATSFDYNSKENDELRPIDIFFKSMSETVKNFPQHLVTKAKIRVCNLIGELELQAYLHKNPIVSGDTLPKKQQNVMFNNLFC